MSRRNPFERAVEFGRASFRDGLPKSANPYDDKRKVCGRLTWSRAWLKAWDDGWDEAKTTAELDRPSDPESPTVRLECGCNEFWLDAQQAKAVMHYLQRLVVQQHDELGYCVTISCTKLT